MPSFFSDIGTANRFAPLARPEPIVHRDREFRTSRPHRRSRNSRGTKEAKQRRDSRRSRRKFAVHLLDEQLSHDFEETLTQYNIHPAPPVSLATLAPTLPTTSTSQRIGNNGSTHVAPSAPQLPPITFHGFSLPDFPPLNIPRASSLPSPRHMLPGVPTWCPPIPSLTSTGGHTDGLPKFYDLSCLQEPKQRCEVDTKCQDLQLWQGSPVSMPKKQSRFFPPRATSPKPTVRLPPTGPKCQIPGAGLHDPSNLAWNIATASVKSDPIKQAIERVIAAGTVAQASGQESHQPSAANLWNILAHCGREVIETASELKMCYCKDEEADVEPLPVPVFNGQLGPFELASSDVPYVHANTLTGYANETAAHHSESNVMEDSAIYLTEMFSSSNNTPSAYEGYEVPSQEPLYVSRPALPMSGYADPVSNVDIETHTDKVLETSIELAGDELEDSAAHFTSEQDLFAPPPPLLEQTSQSPTASFCDLATFLSMGHAENCWCLACEGEPELVSEETAQEPDEALTEDDGWMVWSTVGCENVSTDTAETESTADDVPANDNNAGTRQYVRSETWDDFFPRKSRHARALIKSEPDAQFLGYYDDGAAFASAEKYASEEEWEWSF